MALTGRSLDNYFFASTTYIRELIFIFCVVELYVEERILLEP